MVIKAPLVLMPRIDGIDNRTDVTSDELNLFDFANDPRASLSSYLHNLYIQNICPFRTKYCDLVLLESTLLIPLSNYIGDSLGSSPFGSNGLLTITIVETDICELVTLLMC